MLFQNNISFKRIWQDDEFFRLEILCSGSAVTAVTEIYADDSDIDELTSVIKRFLDGDSAANYWRCGDLVNYGVEFEFSSDKQGHIKIEVYMKITDGESDNEHECCFFVNTEHGMLYKFMSELHRLKEKTLRAEVSLA